MLIDPHYKETERIIHSRSDLDRTTAVKNVSFYVLASLLFSDQPTAERAVKLINK